MSCDPDRPFLVLWGATFPSQNDTGWTIPLRDEIPEHRRMMIPTVQMLPEVPDRPNGVFWPYRSGHVALGVNMMIGTIDELTELFRERLLACVAELTAPEVVGPYKDTEAARAQARLFGYEPGQAITKELPARHEEPYLTHLLRQAGWAGLMKHFPPLAWYNEPLTLKSSTGEVVRENVTIEYTQLLPPNNTGLQLRHVYWLCREGWDEQYDIVITSEADEQGRVKFYPAGLYDFDKD